LNDLRNDLAAIEKRIEEATNELVNVATKRKEIVGSINPAELSNEALKREEINHFRYYQI